MPGPHLRPRPKPVSPLRREPRRPEPVESLLPRRALHWLPFFWSRVLFPGSADQAGPWRWRPFVLVLLLSGALLYPCLSFELFEPDEGRYAQIPREMLDRGDWLVPTLQGEPYLDKPPLFYWLVMLSYGLFGYHDWAARLVPALAMHGCVAATYLLGRRLVGDRAAFWGSLLLTVSPAALGMGRLLLLDGVLTLCVTVAIFAALLAQRGPRLHGGWWLLAALACGLGVLTKGPVALVLVLPPLLAHRRLVAACAPLGRNAWLAFAGVLASLTLPWFVAACVRLPEFGYYFFWQHNVLRFAQPFDHERPVWFYLPILLGGLLPLTLLAWPLLRFLDSGDDPVVRRRSPELGYLLLAGGWCVLFFSLSGCKLPTYVLPAFAPLCLAAGCGLVHSGWHRARYTLGVVGGCWLALAVAHYVVVPWQARVRSPLTGPGPLLELCRDPNVPVVGFPRNVDSLAFYLGRSDFRSYRSKELAQLLEFLDREPRVVVLFGHRNSLETLRLRLPPHLHVTRAAPMGLCDMAVIERR